MLLPEEQNQALERAEGARREGSARNQSPLPVATPRAAAASVSPADRNLQAMRLQAHEQLRDLGIEPPRFLGHRERTRARAQQGQQPQADLPGRGKSKKCKVIDLTLD
ncbi:hypothetical protein PG996_004166 [Apiospora saccharicola]|uniref:Uncharacterized protein n=1 Tax=Apiospora saccharicola TaxID=335842 RepID=A0ABR1W3E7_9PEZI